MRFEFKQQTRLEEAIERFTLMKAERERIEEEYRKAQELVVYELEAEGYKSKTYGGYKATLVQNEILKVDEKGLRKALGAQVFNKLLVKKFDKKKLEQAVEEGVVDRMVVSQHSTIEKSSPFIRLTGGQGSDD